MSIQEVRAVRVRFAIPPLLFWAGLALLGYGFVHYALWRTIAPDPLEFIGLLVLVAVAIACALAWGCKWYSATALLVITLATLVYFADAGPSVAVLLIGLAALGVGSIFVPAEWNACVSLAVLVGLALICGVDGWLLPFHIHVRALYTPVLLTIILWRRRSIIAMLRPIAAEWSRAVESARWPALLGVLAVCIASTGSWLPTVLYDDLSYHLALPSQLAQLGYYQMNVGSNVWALAPWASDVLQGIAQVVAGAEARGVVDALWFALSCVLMWKLCEELELPPGMRWVGLALYAALPLSTYLLDSMQTEGPTSAVLAALALLIARKPRDNARTVIVLGLLFGLLLGLKVSNVWFAGPLGLWWLWRNRWQLPWKALPLALLFGLIVAGSSYVYAWALTGNPVLPLFNGVFQSPWFSTINFHDKRWDTGFHWDIVWNLVFHAGVYTDGGGPTFILIALGGSFLMALTQRRTRGLALVGATALLLPLSQVQYFRYAYPSLVLLLPVMLCGVRVTRVGHRQAQGMMVAVWLLVVLSFVFNSGGGWQLKAGAVKTLVESGRSAVIALLAPVRPAVKAIGDRYGESARVLVLVPGSPFAAEMAGRAFVTNWYDPQLSALALKAHDGAGVAGWLALFDQSGANFLVTREGQVDNDLMQAIQSRRGARVFAKSGIDVWKLSAARDGHFVQAGPHGWRVTFDTAGTPAGATLAAARVELSCDSAHQGHVVVHWHVEDALVVHGDHSDWAPCLRNGVAIASVHFRAPATVTELQVTVQPGSSMDMGLEPVSATASLTRDLTAERDIAPRVRQVFRSESGHQRQIAWFAP